MFKRSSLLLVMMLLVNACVSTSPPVSPSSLEHFRDVLVDLNTASIEALTFEYQWSYRNFKENIKSQDQTDPAPLKLDFCSGVFDWRWGECDSGEGKLPVFNATAQMRSRLTEINQAMIDYANFLVLLNAANENSKAILDDAAEKAGVAAKNIAAHSKLDFDGAKFGAFSTIGVSVVQQLLAKKQRQGMAAVMADFQPGVQQFANLGSMAMQISTIGIKKEYGTEYKTIADAIATKTTDGTKRAALVEKLLALNEQTILQLDSRMRLYAAYKSLPDAHTQLVAALESGRHASLEELVGHIEMISEVRQTIQ